MTSSSKAAACCFKYKIDIAILLNLQGSTRSHHRRPSSTIEKILQFEPATGITRRFKHNNLLLVPENDIRNQCMSMRDMTNTSHLRTGTVQVEHVFDRGVKITHRIRITCSQHTILAKTPSRTVQPKSLTNVGAVRKRFHQAWCYGSLELRISDCRKRQTRRTSRRQLPYGSCRHERLVRRGRRNRLVICHT